MPEEEADVEHSEPTRSIVPKLPGVHISRVIEYLPDGGDVPVARDCTYAGQSYSAGAVIKMDDGKTHVCSGDKNGMWLVET
jgi:hypothetical protein